MIPQPIIATTLAFVALCVVGDLRTRRIPNLLSGLGMVVGIALNTLYFGHDGLLASIGGLLAAIAVLLFPFAMGGVGGGDVKMMGAIGALLGPRTTLVALLIGMALGGAIMAVHLARLGRLRETLRTVATMAASSVVGGSLEPLRVSAGQPGTITLPYSVPLGLGTLAMLALSGRLALS
jgi:prepilin peptidase CpaA